MPCKDAVNDVYDGIHCLTSAIKEGTLLICSECVNLIREMEGYCWDPKKTLRGEDEPIKANDHLCDSLRYAYYTFTGGGKRSPQNPNEVYRRQEELRQQHWLYGRR
jgi:hypothetical protein